MEYLEKNLEKLRKYRKYFYEKLIDIMQKGDLKYDRFNILTTRDGDKTIEIAVTATACFPSVVLSGQMIFWNSAFSPLKKPTFSLLLSPITLTPVLKKRIILFLCVKYESCRIYNISLFPFCQDDSFYPLSCCSYGSCTLYKPM